MSAETPSPTDPVATRPGQMPDPATVAPPGMERASDVAPEAKTDPSNPVVEEPVAETPPYPSRAVAAPVASVAGPPHDRDNGTTTRQEDRKVIVTIAGHWLFATDTSELRDASLATLDTVLATLQQHGGTGHIEVTGHTDTEGLDEINRPLSLDRANAVREYFVTHGFDPARVTAAGLGSSRPVADNSVAELRVQNRRIEVTLYPTDAIAAEPA